MLILCCWLNLIVCMFTAKTCFSDNCCIPYRLRNSQHGYWNFIRNFCQKDTIQAIHQLKCVFSGIGRGMALSVMFSK